MNPIMPCSVPSGQHSWLPAANKSGKGVECYSCPMCGQKIYWSAITQRWVNVTKDESQKQADPAARNFDSYHWVVCDKKGKVDVYHVGECAGGEECDLFVYLSTGDNMDKHLKRDTEYEVTKDKDGQFEFSMTSKTGSDIIKSTPRESTQISLLEKP